MDPTNEKRDAFAKAKEQLSLNDNTALRYAALELRRCLEAIIYEKLWAYRSRIPVSVARRWQPPQAFRALAVVEPDVAQSSVIRFAREETPGGPPTHPFVQLGVDRRPTQTWLNKTYNKLGSMLHAKWPYADQPNVEDTRETRDYLDRVVGELEPYVNCTFTSTLAELINFQCSLCGETVFANSEGVERSNEVTCLNPNCVAHYLVTKQGESFAVQLDVSSTNCSDCGERIEIPAHKLQIGYDFECKKCGSLFSVSEHSWRFTKRENNQTGSA